MLFFSANVQRQTLCYERQKKNSFIPFDAQTTVQKNITPRMITFAKNTREIGKIGCASFFFLSLNVHSLSNVNRTSFPTNSNRKKKYMQTKTCAMTVDQKIILYYFDEMCKFFIWILFRKHRMSLYMRHNRRTRTYVRCVYACVWVHG